jgi:RND family efflux transporter MFP subunit
VRHCILLLTGLLALAGCGDEIKPGRTEHATVEVGGLTTATVGPLQNSLQRALNGTLEAPDQSQLMARLPGRVARIVIHEGQRAKAGATILTLDQQTATDELAAALAASQAAEGGLAEAEAQEQLAIRTLQRYQQLKEGEAVTRQELDQVNMEEEAARQRVLAARANLAKARAGLEAARVMAGQANLRSPFDARINRILVDTGSTVMPGTPLVELDRIAPWLVSLEVPESLVGQFLADSEFSVEIPSTAQTFTAALAEVYPAVNPVTRTQTVKLRLPADADLNAGLFARVFLPDAGPGSLFVPASAIVTRGQLTAVYVVADGVLHYRLVRTGSTLDGRTEILSGLSPGEKIVTEGANRARHGARVEG